MDLKHEKTFNFTHTRESYRKFSPIRQAKIQKLDNTVSQQAVGK